VIPILLLDRKALRRRSVAVFIRTLAQRHPEMREPVTYQHFLKIAEREGVSVRVVPLSRPARLIRAGRFPCIQLDRSLSRDERAIYGMHELCHYWRDDSGEPCYHAEDDAMIDAQESFADVFAWVVTSPAGRLLPGLRDEDF
jgi:hypothetical protein